MELVAVHAFLSTFSSIPTRQISIVSLRTLLSALKGNVGVVGAPESCTPLAFGKVERNRLGVAIPDIPAADMYLLMRLLECEKNHSLFHFTDVSDTVVIRLHPSKQLDGLLMTPMA